MSSLTHQSPPFSGIAFHQWQALAEDLKSGKRESTASLPDNTTSLIYRIRSTAPAGGWRAGESWFLAPCLSLEEATALLANLSRPDRNLCSLKLMPANHLEILPTPLVDVLADEACRKELQNRLKSITPYGDETLPTGGEWVWFVQAQEHWNLWLHEGQLYFPAGWSTDKWLENIGPLKSYEGVFHVTNGQGLAGLADLAGKMRLPCRYRWLSDVSHYHHPERRLEAQLPEALSEEGDLIDLDGRRINPPGIKLLAGTFTAWGQAVVVREGEGNTGLKGLMDIEGRLRGEMRWCWINTMHHDKRAAVQDDTTHLWGYIDADGQLVIPCKFCEAQPFNNGRAFVKSAQEGASGMGLIDTEGQFAIEPRWKSISHLRHDYLVEDFEGRHAVIDRDGKVLLEPQFLTLDTADEVFDDREQRIARAVQTALDAHPRHAEALRRIAADPQCRLAGLTGLFGKRADERDLMAARLWGMRVAIIEDRQWNGWDFKAGDEGMIFWQYPVSASLFDLAVEAPVMGLFGRNEQCLGVAWELLRHLNKGNPSDTP